jgi:hypothetical protein
VPDDTGRTPSDRVEETPPCLSCGKPSVWTSPTGHHFCADCRNLFDSLFPEGLPGHPEGLQPVDLHALMSGERPEEDWLVEPVLPAGKLCGIVSKRGEGKSLLLLDVAAALACGQATLSQPAAEPINVVYVDMEMGPDDLYERLADLGYLPDHPLFHDLAEHLHYYQLVALPPLDTEAGGIALEELVDRHGATLVVIDTVSRVVSGEENSAEPYRDLFRHTETRLKRRRVTLARLDHLGKDKERGSRGSSAKEDPLDVVWQLTKTLTGSIELTLTKGRQGWIPRAVTIHKEERYDGTFEHVLPHEPAPTWLVELADRIQALNLPADTSTNLILHELKEAGRGARKSSINQARRFLRGRVAGGNRNPVTTQTALQYPPSVTGGNHPAETLEDIDDSPVTTLVTTPEQVVTGEYPPKGGTTEYPDTQTDDSTPFDDDYEPSPEDLENLPDPN